jgi:hypothetical protein
MEERATIPGMSGIRGQPMDNQPMDKLSGALQTGITQTSELYGESG